MHQMEYRGLNLLDEVCTVEIAIDEQTNTVHILDTNHVIEPTYHFTKKAYELSEGFVQFMEVLRHKPYFSQLKNHTLEQWLHEINWIFYSSNQSVKCYMNQKWAIYLVKQLPNQAIFYRPYVERIN